MDERDLALCKPLQYGSPVVEEYDKDEWAEYAKQKEVEEIDEGSITPIIDLTK